MAEEGEAGCRKGAAEQLARRRPNDRDRYSETWRRLRIAWAVMYGGWFFLLPFGVVLPVVIDIRLLPYGLLTAGLVIIAGAHVVHWLRCPKCGRNYWGHPRLRVMPTMLIRKCHYCGLPYGAPCDPDKAEE